MTTGGAGLERLGLFIGVFGCLDDGGVNHALTFSALFRLEAEPVFGANPLGRRLVNHLVDVREHAHAHQVGDDFERLLPQFSGQIANDNRRFDDDDLAADRHHELGAG